MKRDPVYGIMAEFDSAQALIDAARSTLIKRDIKKSMLTVPFQSKVWPKRSAFTRMPFLWWY